MKKTKNTGCGYYLPEAIGAATRAVNRTGTARYIVLTALGYEITRKRPQNVLYMAWQVLRTGQLTEVGSYETQAA